MKKIIISLSIISLIIVGVYIDSTILKIKNHNVRYQVIENEKITESITDYTVLFVSDTHYNNYFHQEDLQRIVDDINQLAPDTVIFLGDLYDATQANITPEIEAKVTELLASIEVKYGKFAIMGEFDIVNQEMENIVKNTYNNSGFELLNNQSIQLHKSDKEFINLISINTADPLLSDPTKALSKINPETFNILISHKLSLDYLKDSTLIDLYVSGHTHGGQVNLPYFGSLLDNDFNQDYLSGVYHYNNCQIDINSGVATTQFKVRFNSQAEIVLYRFTNLQKNQTK